MIKLLILYYLSIKDTHGYEIQKFIQLNHMNDWNNIQSGSIYYAMSKLEKEGFIEVQKKVGDKEKSKRIYTITSSGRKALTKLARQELQNPIGNVASDKFLIYPIVGVLDKAELIEEIGKHIGTLKQQRENINKWYEKKIASATEIEQATFELMLSNIKSQIKWHEILVKDIDQTLKVVSEISELIKKVDFSTEKEIEFKSI